MNLFHALGRILACAHPLILSHPDEDYPFFQGTCFTVRYGGRFFILSAFHCFKDVDVKSTRIDCGKPQNDYFPLKRWSRVEGSDSVVPDLADIAVFEVDMERMTDAELSRAPALELANTFDGASGLPSGCDLVLEGYPYERAEYSPELRMTVRPSCKLLAVYEGPAGSPGISDLSLLECGHLRDLNGMSGSPILAVRCLSGGKAKWCLAGMLIRGDLSQKRASFIDSAILVSALKQCVQN
jgi:hypothetical protein